jgi:hypothetical protein
MLTAFGDYAVDKPGWRRQPEREPPRFANGIIPKGRQHWVFARADRVVNLRDKTAMDSMVDFNDEISHCPCNKHQFSVVSCLLI